HRVRSQPAVGGRVGGFGRVGEKRVLGGGALVAAVGVVRGQQYLGWGGYPHGMGASDLGDTTGGGDGRQVVRVGQVGRDFVPVHAWWVEHRPVGGYVTQAPAVEIQRRLV